MPTDVNKASAVCFVGRKVSEGAGIVELTYCARLDVSHIEEVTFAQLGIPESVNDAFLVKRPQSVLEAAILAADLSR